MQRSRTVVALVALAPFALAAIVMQLALVLAGAGAAQLALGAQSRSLAQVERGADLLGRSADLVDRIVLGPVSALLATNPLGLRLSGEVTLLARAATDVAQAGAGAARMAAVATGAASGSPLAEGSQVDTDLLATLVTPSHQLADGLAGLRDTLGSTSTSGPVGGPLSELAAPNRDELDEAARLSAALALAMPDLPDALGATGPRRYLVCALNDAELFASGGAPLTAFMIEADDGAISVPISGQLTTDLSPGNPPISWDHAGGPPWYRDGRRYPFVNSNFHPDFRTATTDMTRAWAALGYPQVEGVMTIDVAGLASILRQTGPVRTAGFGQVSADTIVTKVLVDAYREFDTPEGVEARHRNNAELADALGGLITRPGNAPEVVRGILDAIPGRHIQAGFDAPGLQAAVEALGAAGALSDSPGDLVADFSQAAPNKLSVFQDRSIHQDVVLAADGGARVTRTTTFGNDVPEDLGGDPTTWAGYTALRARMRVAYRVPLTATDVAVRVSRDPVDSSGLPGSMPIPSATGPYPDDRGGQVLWQGHETAPRATTTVVLTYRLPAGTFPPDSYRASADPQALLRPVDLTVRVTPADGHTLPQPEGWHRDGSALVWTATLDRPIDLVVD